MKTDKQDILKNGLRGLSIFAVAGLFAACDIQKTEDGEMPSVDVDVQPGNLPEYDVDSRIGIETREKTITVPEITWDDNEDSAADIDERGLTAEERLARQDMNHEEAQPLLPEEMQSQQDVATQQEQMLEDQDSDLLDEEQSSTRSVAQERY